MGILNLFIFRLKIQPSHQSRIIRMVFFPRTSEITALLNYLLPNNLLYIDHHRPEITEKMTKINPIIVVRPKA